MSKKKATPTPLVAEKKRKKQPAYKYVRCTGVISDIGAAFSEIEELASEMRETFDNMEGANMGHMDKCQQAGEAADTLENVSEVEAPEKLDGLPISHSDTVPTRKGRGMSRATRLSNAIAILDAAIFAAQEADCANEDEADARDNFVSELESVVGDIENVEFPGMFG